MEAEEAGNEPPQGFGREQRHAAEPEQPEGNADHPAVAVEAYDILRHNGVVLGKRNFPGVISAA